MTQRKYKVFIDITLVLLCLFPLICLAFAMLTSTSFILNGDYADFIQRFTISTNLANRVGQAINTFGLDFSGSFYQATCTIMSNAILIYIFYTFVACLTWLPKMAISLLNRPFGKS